MGLNVRGDFLPVEADYLPNADAGKWVGSSRPRSPVDPVVGDTK